MVWWLWLVGVVACLPCCSIGCCLFLRVGCRLLFVRCSLFDVGVRLLVFGWLLCVGSRLLLVVVCCVLLLFVV